MKKVIILIISVLLSTACAAKIESIELKKLDDFLFRLETRMICPQFPAASLNSFDVKMCGRFVTYYENLDIILFDYLVFDTSSFLDGFDELDATGKEKSLLSVLRYLSTYTGNKKMEGLEQYFGIIQRTSTTNISTFKYSGKKSTDSMEIFVRDKASVMVTYYDQKNQVWHSAYGNDKDMNYLKSNKPTTIVDFLK